MPKQLHLASFEDACDILGLHPQRDFPISDRGLFLGCGFAVVRDMDGVIKDVAAFKNLITDKGDQYYMDRAAAIGTIPLQVVGMKLGTGATAASKTGAGATIVTYIAGSAKAIDSTWPQGSGPIPGRQVQWKTSWAAGEATNGAIAEVTLSNQAALTDNAGTAADTVSRSVFVPAVNKTGTDTLAVTWNHIGLGA